MIETTLPLVPELWATAPGPAPALFVDQSATLLLSNASLRAQDVAVQAAIRELEARLDQDRSNSSRLSSSDSPQTPR